MIVTALAAGLLWRFTHLPKSSTQILETWWLVKKIPVEDGEIPGAMPATGNFPGAGSAGNLWRA